ncbi:cyclic lactone autoinducer peptide [Anaerosolibacter carboniphilus]|uniref:Cyclic lactone autoinducer peptide n=1 Tax=Anaerosolibacter carboniphilus TaxID=1417629 RepID=A0A841KXP0_9FIRM|nr:cyclic lactone autoinducer peptide [Anaerosolibacter carboniphilus]MBB6214939.1 cyclic lactone autoinducer peptide [Anaerosolibacter carboniphilus]
MKKNIAGKLLAHFFTFSAIVLFVSALASKAAEACLSGLYQEEMPEELL